MPHVQITWVEGRTPEQKRKIAERITNVLIEDGRARRENIHVAFHDVGQRITRKRVCWWRTRSALHKVKGRDVNARPSYFQYLQIGP